MCGQGLYDNPQCDQQCNPTCESCQQYQQTPCYRCVKNCGSIGAGWGDATACNGCDLAHNECIQHSTCSGCYKCEEKCPLDTGGVDYYRSQGCQATCESPLCRQVKLAEPQSQYKDCYRCYDPVCGDDILTSSAGEECEISTTCQQTHSGSGAKYLACDLNDCLCYPNCNMYCADQGKDGYPWISLFPIMSPVKQDCADEMNAQMAALNCGPGVWGCGAYAWFAPKNGQECCCVDVGCGATEAICKANL